MLIDVSEDAPPTVKEGGNCLLDLELRGELQEGATDLMYDLGRRRLVDSKNTVRTCNGMTNTLSKERTARCMEHDARTSYAQLLKDQVEALEKTIDGLVKGVTEKAREENETQCEVTEKALTDQKDALLHEISSWKAKADAYAAKAIELQGRENAYN